MNPLVVAGARCLASMTAWLAFLPLRWAYAYIVLVITMARWIYRVAAGVVGRWMPAKGMPHASTHAEADDRIVVSWPGWGVLFFHQLGMASYLGREFDLQRVHMIGSSAGALVSVLAACQVDPRRSIQQAHELCIEHGVASRPLGLAGIWGAIVRRWLDELLPADAHERCSGRVSIVLTQLPLLSTVSVDRFPTKASLIDAALASAHVPFFMDGQLAASYAGGACIDGSFSYILFGRTQGLVPAGARQLLVCDPWHDKQLRSSWSLQQCLELLGLAGALRLMQQGQDYAAWLHGAGRLPALALAAAADQCTPAVVKAAATDLPALDDHQLLRSAFDAADVHATIQLQIPTAAS